MLLFFILSVIILLLTPAIFNSSKKIFKKFYRWSRDKLIKKQETLFRYIYLLLLWIYVVHFITLALNSSQFDRLIITLSFIVILIIINSFPLVLFMFILFPFEVIPKIFKRIFPTKNAKDDEKKKQNWGNKFSDKFTAISRFRINTILIYSIILLSFSFDLIISNYNYWWIGIILGVLIAIYLFFALLNIFLTQKDLIYISDRFEETGHIINSIKENNIFNISKHFILSFIKSYSKSSNENETLLDKAINWVKMNYKKVQFISKMGVAVFRSLLTIKLITIIITTILFYIIVVSNYLISLENLNILSTSFSLYSEYYLASFYLFIGESTNLYLNSMDANYFAGFTLFLGVSGWLLSVTYIVLYFDIMNLSSSDFNIAVNKAVVTIFQEVKKIMEEMSNEASDPDLDSIIQDLKSDSNTLVTDPEKAAKLKSIIENLGKSQKNDDTSI